MKKTEKDFKATSDDMKNQLAESKNGIAEHKKAIEMLEKKVSMGNLALQNEKTKNSEISELLKEGNNFGKPYKSKSPHVIVTAASFNEMKLLRFLREFYHQDHIEDGKEIKVVIISTDKVSSSVKQVIQMYEE